MRGLAITCLLVAACGDDGVHHLGDAPRADAPSIDGATSGPVSLRLMLDGVPQPGIDVYFQDAASGLIASVPTGTDGVATATMDAGGYVTVIQPFPIVGKGSTVGDVRTFAGVKPGDQLRIDEVTPTFMSITVNVTVPVEPNAIGYDVYTTCGGKNTLVTAGGSGGSPTGDIYLNNCGATTDMLVETTDANGQPASWFFHPSVAVSDLATVTLTDTYVPRTDTTLSFTNVPAPYEALAFGNTSISPRGPLYDVQYATSVTAGAASKMFPRPAFAGATTVTSIHPTPTNLIGSQSVVEWGPASVVAFDLSGALLPLYETTPTFSASTHAVSWTAAAGAAPDFVVSEVYAQRFTAPPNNAWKWRIVAPYATTVTLPVLPASAAQYNITSDDTPVVQELTTAKVPGGYDAVRARLHSVRTAQGLDGLVTGATGRIAYELLENQAQL
jgi:hypothetical protein